MENFKGTLSAGNVKAAMKDVGATSRDLWQVAIGDIRIIEGFNVRVEGEALTLHIRDLADSIKSEGYYPSSPMAGYVGVENGKQVIFLTDGHCRMAGIELANSEGADVQSVPVVVAAKGTSMEDLTVALVRKNAGKSLDPYEIGVVCKRLTGYGLVTSEVARRLGLSAKYVDGLLALMAAPVVLRNMVLSGQASANTVIEAIQKHGNEQALKMLTQGLEKAQKSGGGKVSAKHLPDHEFKKALTRLAPEMYEVIQVLATFEGAEGFDEDVKKRIAKLTEALEFARDAGGAE